jgi:hypothetical protein
LLQFDGFVPSLACLAFVRISELILVKLHVSGSYKSATDRSFSFVTCRISPFSRLRSCSYATHPIFLDSTDKTAVIEADYVQSRMLNWPDGHSSRIRILSEKKWRAADWQALIPLPHDERLHTSPNTRRTPLLEWDLCGSETGCERERTILFLEILLSSY